MLTVEVVKLSRRVWAVVVLDELLTSMVVYTTVVVWDQPELM